MENPVFHSTLIMDEIEESFAEFDYFESLIAALEEVLVCSKDKE